ncbi:hypothetical protein A4G20_05185 [Pasteurellaceae bacterium RH1A]|nr:hypothetical protein A4G20_05185 [Pasteurellaceae bacterium RH1A]
MLTEKNNGPLFPSFNLNHIEQFAYMPYLSKLRLLCLDLKKIPDGLDKFTHLLHLELSGNVKLGDENIEKEIEKLFKLAKALPQLEHLQIEYTPLAHYFKENQSKLDELKSLIPRCKIEI